MNLKFQIIMSVQQLYFNFRNLLKISQSQKRKPKEVAYRQAQRI